MLRNINQTIEAENAEFKLAQSKVIIYYKLLIGEISHSSNKRESSVDN